MATPLYPAAQKRIVDASETIIATQVDPWGFLNAGVRVQVKRFDGRDISYQGITFEGSPREVFWGGYIEPFLEDMVVREIALTMTACRDREIDARVELPELQGLLVYACQKVFSHMTNLDQRLLANGDPQSVPLRSIESELKLMTEFIRAHSAAELKMWKPRTLQIWWSHNQFWAWIVGVLTAIAGIFIAAKAAKIF
jgi:hypothetical protein